MIRSRRLLLPLCLAAMLDIAGCTSRQSSLESLYAQPTVEYRGHYTRGPAGSWFLPCGSTSAETAWWVTVADAAVARLDSASRAGAFVEGRPSFVRWRGVPTRNGEFGPPDVTALLVREIVAIRPAAASDCAAP